jgi:hypothetical protein
MSLMCPVFLKLRKMMLRSPWHHPNRSCGNDATLIAPLMMLLQYCSMQPALTLKSI